MSAPSSGPPRTATLTVVHPELRQWLQAVADAVIPAGDGMPAASSVDVAGRQLDLVLSARPDLLPALEEAHRRTEDVPTDRILEHLPQEIAQDLLLIVAGGYYMSPVVTGLLKYTGQSPEPVRADVYPAYVEEVLLDAVLARGPIYRAVDGRADQDNPVARDDTGSVRTHEPAE